VAVARQAERSVQPKLLEALGRLDIAKLGEATRLDLLRAYQLAFIRLGEPSAEVGAALAKKLDAIYPNASDKLNRELCIVLVFLKSPTVVSKSLAMMQQPSKEDDPFGSEVLARNSRYGGTIAAMLKNRPETQKLALAFALRNAKEGWTTDQRKFYFQWLQDARGKSGGASYGNFLRNMDNDAFAHVPELDRLALTSGGIRKVYSAPELPKAKGPGHDWTLSEVMALQGDLKRRNFENGKRAYAAARCVVCHRFGGEGGATGPDLTQLAGRFTYKDVTESILDPSKVVSDLYRGVIIETADGKTYNGRVVSDAPDSLTILTDPEDPSKLVTVKKKDIETKVQSPQSLMPKDLLKQLNQDEVLDLMAYLLSRGNQRDQIFKKDKNK
jgi:putative heme-binding domain-containing protein